jgi:PKD repeat protein
LTGLAPLPVLQVSFVIALLLVAGLFVVTPGDPIVPTMTDTYFEDPPDEGPPQGNNTTDPDMNRPPVVNAGSDVVVMEGGTILLIGSAIDSDGIVILFEWDFDGDGIYDWYDPFTGVTEVTYGMPGNFTAVLRATDDRRDTGLATVLVTVFPDPTNRPPVAFAGDDVEVDRADAVEFQMTGNDTDGTIVKYEWDYDGDGTFDDVSQLARTTYHIYIEPGEYVATLRVTDDEGAEAIDTRTITVLETAVNQLPIANAGPDRQVVAGQTVTLVGTGSDVDGWIIEYRWDFNGDNEFDWTSTTTGSADTVYVAAGTFTARLLVIDNNETAATDTIRVTVTEAPVNQPPVADAGSDALQTVLEGTEMEFWGKGSDPDGLVVLYQWDFDGDGAWDWEDDRESIARWTYESIGTYTAKLRVTDNEGATDEDTLTVKVTSSSSEGPFWPSDGKISIGALGTWTFDPNEVETVRPDIFAENHFSLFDILVHLHDKGEIVMQYHFDEDLNTHVIDKINDVGNWWYWAYYHMGWQETNNFRMDHYPYKDKTVVHMFREDPSRVDKIHQVFREEVTRKANNDGKVIIPKVILRLRTKTLTFTDVEVTAHDLRNDTFQPGVITAIDVILSLADQEKITYKLTWYETIGFAEILNYFVDGINDNIAHGTCGFVYEEGSEKLRWGNHIHIPSDYRVLNSPEYEEWFWICL